MKLKLLSWIKMGHRNTIARQAHVIWLVLLLFAVICSCGQGNQTVPLFVTQTNWTLGEESPQVDRSYDRVIRHYTSPSSLQDLTKLLISEDFEVRINIVNLLTRLRRDGIINADVVLEIVPALLEVIADGSTSESETAIIALINATTGVLVENEQGKYNSSLDESRRNSLSIAVINTLADTLSVERGRISQYSAHALAPYGEQAGIALPGLRSLLNQQDDITRLEAAIAIGSIDPDGAGDIVPILVYGIRSVEGISIRKRAISTLGFMGENAGEALPLLHELAGDSTSPFRSDARIAIEEISRSEI